MKIRNGFVSNSSSSSFILYTKNVDFSEELILEELKVDSDSPLYKFASDMSHWFYHNLEETNFEKLFKNYCWDEHKNMTDTEKMDMLEEESDLSREDIQLVYDKKHKCYMGSASDEEGGIEAYLCDTGFNLETDKLKIGGEGGY